MDRIIETINLSKHYGLQKAVDRINITVGPGEIYGFLGRNGAGKTTTIRMLLGLIRPSEGEIKIFGEDFSANKREILKRIGSTIEFSGFYNNLSAVDNLKINATLIGIKKKDAIKEVLNIVGLYKERNKAVGNYSLGMKQRLGIARAILHDPELLILDEPTNGLDPVGIKEIRKFIKTLAEKKRITIFMSSHILSEVEQLADTIGVIHQGRLVEEINFEELRKKNRRYIELKVSDDARTTLLLENEFGIEDYEVYPEETIRIYTDHDKVARINKVLVNEDIEVSKIKLSEDNLEDYFVKLTGGEVIE
ncbi:ATP-binding cassette domain-containing protein [Iocasia frigidifontis]|uniref:ATP-binding cassette domain-containing protein n=1 Tax=Iocasia fonsfrigidae TaxID=2682810 RepID=A0A8A7KJN0_9FIRM|nr:ABC transporter ATP-binding protein [Iocasia fonsfrigidae]QTL98324.1 ATP-binding cassette domain-containing protein [Iocasia fonsfrigidae]